MQQSYDSLNRISQANTINTTSTNCWGEVYTIDAWGNVTNRAGPSGMSGSCTAELLNANPANTSNQLNLLVNYDAAGNALADAYGNAITYDAENRIVTDAGVTYYYDADSVRMEKSSGTMYWPGPGGETLTETGIYYYRARYFDPKAGRFLSEDQTRLRGGINFYAYTRNRPVLLTDPSGHQAGCPPQSPNCVPSDPDAPYQGSDGLWYNTLDWNGQLDPAPSVPDDGPTPPSPPPSSPAICAKKCDLVNAIAKSLAKKLAVHFVVDYALDSEWVIDTAYSVSVAVAEDGIPIAGQLIALYEVTEFAGEVYVEYQECKNGGS